MIKEVLDGLDTVAKAITNIKKISDAVKEGRQYLAVKHPAVRKDLRDLVSEIRKSMNLIAQASAVLTQFRFAVSADQRSSELVRFNDYFIHHKSEAQFLRNHLDDLRTHCSKIRLHAENIIKSATTPGFASLFALLGLNSPQREKELGDKLQTLANEDNEVANNSRVILDCLETALREVQNALGDQGAMYEQNVPKAAALLAEYAQKFEALERPARSAAHDMESIVAML